ncbi:MAG TPA: hypothetical protein PK225_03720 [Azonexus sp.]|nr:hypothetical protein [Azonexus sp.]
MSDLIERLRKWGEGESLARHFLGTRPAREDCAEAAATIARQQVMLDRALEASFDDKARADRAEAEIARLEDVLEIVAAGPILGEPMARWINHMMAKARAALSRPHATKGDEG